VISLARQVCIFLFCSRIKAVAGIVKSTSRMMISILSNFLIFLPVFPENVKKRKKVQIPS
jgi:hypothetical protein